jgi:TolB-like protein/DNA-binding winged helix-turn-helix (wHTH) protein/Flp pilus assembly protein TadD
MTPTEIRFDGWTLRTDSGELARDGAVTRLQDQPLQVLVELLTHPGELVTREQLIARLWPKGVVDYETGLNTVVRKLRAALGEDANSPRYIETIPRKGYRFIGTLEPIAEPAAVQPFAPARVAEPSPPEPRDTPPAAAAPTHMERPASNRRVLWWIVALALAVALVLAGIRFVRQDAPVASSLAVLPFKPLLPDATNPALELGMTDTLITQLSMIPGLRVSPLTAVRPYEAEDRDPLEAGRSLKVDAVLEGSLQADQQRLRVSARLLRVSDGQALWAGEFNEPMAGIFELQDAFARKVVAALAVRLSPEQSERLAHPATTSTAAYQHYASGLYLWQQRRPEAAEEFEAALRDDPQYALAWSGLAGALASQAVYGYSPPEAVFPRAKQSALKSVELDPQLAEAHTALGHVLVQYERRYQEGEQQYLAALRLAPDNATSWFRIGIARASLGRLDEGIDDLRRASNLEPLTLNHAANLAMLLYLKRDYAAAEAEINRVLALDPEFDQALAVRGRVLLAQGKADAAIEQFKRQKRPVPGGDGDLGRAYARAGRIEDARAEIARLGERAARGYGVGYDLAGIYAAMGDTNEACDALRRALTDHSQLVGFLPYDPAMDPLRSQRCYEEVVQRLRVPPN